MVILDSARITPTTVISQPFANVHNLIDNRSNVSDPVNPTDTGTTRTRKFVYSRMPHFGRTFEGFPFILIPRMKPTKGKGTADLTKVFRDYNGTIMVFSQDKTTDSSGNPFGLETRDDIVNDIIETIDSPTNARALSCQGMAPFEYDFDINDEDELEGKTVFSATFDIISPDNLIKTS